VICYKQQGLFIPCQNNNHSKYCDKNCVIVYVIVFEAGQAPHPRINYPRWTAIP